MPKNKEIVDEFAVPKRIQNKERRVNLKCKRKRNLIKKAIELNKMLDMSIFMVMLDRDTGKYFQYSSGDERTGHFDLERVCMELNQVMGDIKKLKVYDDDDFNKLKVTRNSDRDDGGDHMLRGNTFDFLSKKRH